MAGALSLTGLVKRFGDEVAVDGLDLEIGAGEFFSLLGPSGCGKTTTLRLIAGFERPDAGAIHLDGRDLSEVAPHHRPVNTVFQSYALFPFLDVADNVAFGLRYQRAGRQEVRRRVAAALDHVQMGAFATRKPHQLSGGQQQRVALARALVLEPTVLLLDEPMGALDAKLRKQLQLELRSLQRLVGTTFVYVTHDQEEALTMSDRLAVLHAGRVMQVGTPSEVYSRPANRYVATFLGSTNLFAATVSAIGPDGVVCRVADTLLSVAKCEHDPRVGDEVSLMVRPERIEVTPCGPPGPDGGPTTACGGSGVVAGDPGVEPGDASGRSGDAGDPVGGSNVLAGHVAALTFRGANTTVTLDCGGIALEAHVANVHGEPPLWLSTGFPVEARVSPSALRLLVS
jgi:spermidine/putrescine transport system ATP-binding protein